MTDEVSSHENTVLKVHPAAYRQRPFQFLAALALVALGIVGLVSWRDQELLARMLGWAGVVVGGLLLLWWFIYSRFTALTLTDIRSIYRRGIVARRTSEVRHNDVRNLQMHQDISDRLFGVGRISISSAGQDDVEIEARGMPHPSQIVKLIRDYQS